MTTGWPVAGCAGATASREGSARLSGPSQCGFREEVNQLSPRERLRHSRAISRAATDLKLLRTTAVTFSICRDLDASDCRRPSLLPSATTCRLSRPASPHSMTGSGGGRVPICSAVPRGRMSAARADPIIVYYTLAAGAIAYTPLPARSPRCPAECGATCRDPIPMAVLGRLAVDQAWQGRGLGRLLLRDALLRTCQAAAIVPVRGILVHALSPPARRFYDGYGSSRIARKLEDASRLGAGRRRYAAECISPKRRSQPLAFCGFASNCHGVDWRPNKLSQGSRRDLPRRLLATSPDPAAEV